MHAPHPWCSPSVFAVLSRRFASPKAAAPSQRLVHPPSFVSPAPPQLLKQLCQYLHTLAPPTQGPARVCN